MPPAFPTVSITQTELDSKGYDVRKLMQLARSGLRSTTDDAPAVASATGPAKVHLHTLSIEISLLPSVPQFTYPGRPVEANPTYTAYDELRTFLIDKREPLVPLSIFTPSQRTLDTTTWSPFTHQKQVNIGVFPVDRADGTPAILLFSPKPASANPRLKCGYLRIGGTEEWLPSSQSWDCLNWLHAALAVTGSNVMRKEKYHDKVDRFLLRTGLDLCWEQCEETMRDREGNSMGDSIIKAIITVDLYADPAGLAIPSKDIQADLIGLILHSVIPAEVRSTSSTDTDPRVRALKDFFACMRPAPEISPDVSDDLQPTSMKAKLLPFQKRTLRLLLEREGAAGYEAGEPKMMGDPNGFWKLIQLGQDPSRTAFRRLDANLTLLPAPVAAKDNRKGKGRVQLAEEGIDGMRAVERKALPGLLDLSGVRGTMLCEEMGLGKTVEAIALILRHRHPLCVARPPTIEVKVDPDMEVDMPEPSGSSTPGSAREIDVPVIDLSGDPPGVEDVRLSEWLEKEQEAFKDTKAWNEQSQVHVSETATTLIVTPPSLLKQWVAEIHRHAPSLRVCVYEGWQPLQAGVKKAQLSQNRTAVVRLADRKRKAVQRTREKTANKYARIEKVNRNGRNTAYDADSNDDEDQIEVDDAFKDDVRTLLDVTQRQFERYVRAHDVVITTYGELAKDLTVAHPAPPRSRRANVDYKFSERPRSPLVMMEWWRVIMDEVQLSGDQSSAAEMVSLIPRRNSLAVSGTPARNDIKDLIGVLRFLRVPALPHDHRLWYRLQQPSMRAAFEGVFSTISVRTTKAEVQSELVIPQQTRFIVPIELSEIELHYYQDTLERQRRIIGRFGNAVDKATLRACLLDLRQICTHIQVGMMLQAADPAVRGQRLFLAKELMTMAEALEKMKNDHTMEYMIEGRMQMRAMIRKARLVMEEKEDPSRFEQATALYERSRELITKQMEPLREELKRLLEASGQKEEDEFDTPDRRLSQQEREKAQAITNARTAIRDLLLLLHQTWFLMGDVHHQTNNAAEEKIAYDKAEEVRKEVLALPIRQSSLAIEKFNKSLEKTPIIKSVDDLRTADVNRRGGLMSADAIEEANELMKILNDKQVHPSASQAIVRADYGSGLIVWNWREKIIELLRTSLVVQDDANPPADEAATPKNDSESKEVNAEEDFYAQNLKNQGEVEAYLIAYAAALTDRKEFLSEERNLLVDHDARGTVKRKTKAAQEAQEAAEALGIADLPDEAEKMLAGLTKERESFRQARKDVCDRPLKSYLMALNNVVLSQSRPEEIAIASGMVTMLKKYIKQQTDLFDALYKELDSLRAVFNKRIKFFAALQAISDSVEAPNYKRLKESIEECTGTINACEARLATMAVKGRYLAFIGSKDQTDEDVRDDCIICMGSSDDSKGVLLECGHFFCASCFQAYKQSANGYRCPSCRVRINEQGIHKVKLNQPAAAGAGVTAPDGTTSADAASSNSASGSANRSTAAADEFWAKDLAEDSEKREARRALEQANLMSLEKRRIIAHMDMMGEFGTKIDFLVKHLLYYKSVEPRKRHVIFSNWSDSLKIVTQALIANGITFASFDQKTKTKNVVDDFIKDKSIMVFLLHAERESAGLTLTTASVCHLLEPVLRHSYELQAIGRVDRLGQKNETQVFCYATKDTVESRILALGIRNGTSIYVKPGSEIAGAKDEKGMENVVSAAGKGGDLGGDSTEDELLSLIL